jgi:hypothetical protein
VADIEQHPKEFFVGVVSTEEHLKAQESNRPRYAAALHVLQNKSVAIAQSKFATIILKSDRSHALLLSQSCCDCCECTMYVYLEKKNNNFEKLDAI